MAQDEGFARWGEGAPASPVVLSVPHGGRDYPPALLAALRVPTGALVALEDRWIDAVAEAAWRGEAMLVQRRGRAWIDLNRHERERDPRVDAGASGAGAHASAKVRGGLGLVPRRGSGATHLWCRRFSDIEIAERIAADHRPYHAALEGTLAAARARFGAAVLVDLHSMPSLGTGQPQVVLGDRFGRSAGRRFVDRAAAALTGQGLRVATNVPYAGGHIVDRHGRPAAGIHAIQIELDRALYLDARLHGPGDGLIATAAAVREVVDALSDEAGPGLPLPLAAE